MDRTVGEHIAEMENRLKLLNEEIMHNELSRARWNQIETEIRAVNLVLTHFRSALALEREIPPPKVS